MPRSCPCHKASRKSKKRNPSHRLKFKDFVRGEWWIDKYGESMFADGDIGEQNHDMVATDYMVDKDSLIEGLLENEYITEEEADDYRSDEVTSSQIMAERNILAPIGKEAVGGDLQKWIDITSSPSMAFAKYEGAIKVIGNAFYAYKVTKQTIDAIKGFILEQTEGETLEDMDDDICIEEFVSHRTVCLPVNKFVAVVETVKDLWLMIETQELWDSVLKENPFGGDAPKSRVSTLKMRTYDGWNERPKATYGTLIVVKQGKWYFLAHRLGLQLGQPWSNLQYVANKARFYTKDPEGMELLARALIAWGSGAKDDPVLETVAEDGLFNSWAWARRLSKQEKTRR